MLNATNVPGRDVQSGYWNERELPYFGVTNRNGWALSFAKAPRHAKEIEIVEVANFGSGFVYEV